MPTRALISDQFIGLYRRLKPEPSTELHAALEFDQGRTQVQVFAETATERESSDGL